MTVNELIAKLNQFNPDGKAQVCVRPREYDDEGVYDYIQFFCVEENSADGNLVLLIHTTEDEIPVITAQELIAKLNKFNPDGSLKVYCNNPNYHEREDYCEISYFSMNNACGQFVIEIHTYEI